MKKRGSSIAASNDLIDRKAHAKHAHLWFGRDQHDYRWMAHDAPIPEDRATVRAAFVDSDGNAKLLLESEAGELREFYAEHVGLDPKGGTP